jgi:hypothetical protein
MQNLEQDLKSKETEALKAIAIATFINSAVAAIPTIGAEVPKQVGIATGDLFLLSAIYDIYFRDVEHEDFRFIIVPGIAGLERVLAMYVGKEMEGIATQVIPVASLGLTHYTGKVLQGIFDELLDLGGPPAWLVSGIANGSVTLLVSWLFHEYCKWRYIEIRKGTVSANS